MARYNRHVNPAFQNNTTGWTASNIQAALRRIASAGPLGSGFIADGTSVSGTRPNIRTTGSGGGLAPVTPGETYTLSVYVYQGSGATRTCEIHADFVHPTNGVRTDATAAFNVPNQTWTRLTVTATAAAGETQLSLWAGFWFTGTIPPGAHYIAVSNAMVEDGTSSPNYRDGNSPGWAWTGTAGNSQSRDLDPIANAGSDQAVTEGDTVFLSGTGSNPEGGAVTYAWTVLDADGTGLTNANISNRLTANASFTAPTPAGSAAEIVLRLTVTDGNGNTGTDDVVITVSRATLLEFTGSGGLDLGGSATVLYNRGNDVTGDGGLRVGGSADVLRTLSAVVAGDGGLRASGTVPPLFITPTFVTGSGGLRVGGQAVYRYRAASVPAAVTIEWDLDGDGHFSREEETITDYVVSLESLTGRDYPSQLTGRAGPGKLRVELLNQDNRFSHFNAASPLNNDGMSLQVGSRLRLRTVESTNPDVTRLAFDTFNRPLSAVLGTSDSGHAWSGQFDIANNRAVPEGTGFNLATIDVGTATHFIQATVGNLGVADAVGGGNGIGLIYRYANATNFSRLQYNVGAGRVQVVDRIAGTDTIRAFYSVEPYDGMVLGAYVTGTSVTWYLDGVALGTTTAGVAGGTRCGIHATSPAAHATPWVDDLVVWDKPAATSPGILWTGHVTDISESVELGPRRRVILDAEGPLAQAASAEVYPTSSAYGRRTGTVVGNTLARAGMLDPPGPLQLGELTTGAFGYEKSKALEVCRDFEEAELGFLYETQEGRIGFEARTARASRTSQAVFADFEGAQLGYHRLEPRDWRREIVNRVEAGIAGTAPAGNRNYVWTNYADPPSGLAGVPAANAGVFWIRPSDANTPLTRGQLLIVMIACPRPRGYNSGVWQDAAVFWEPQGWTAVDGEQTFNGDSVPGPQDEAPRLRVYAKIATGYETSPVCFGYIRDDIEGDTFYGESYNATNRIPYVVSMYNVDNFFGDIKEGISVSEPQIWGSGGTAPGYPVPAVFPDWGPEHPSLFLSAVTVSGTNIGSTKLSASPSLIPPDGYHQQTESPTYRVRNGGSSSSSGMYISMHWAERYGSVSVESPTRWRPIISTASQFIALRTIAVRGRNGDPPIKSGHVTVTRDDVASQRKYKVIRTHREESNLFPDDQAAGAYGDLVLARHAGERPIMALSYWANTTIAHRTQAITRRVGDRITVESDNDTGLNYSGDYFIESIEHRIANGGKTWEVTYELSPA